MRSPSRFVALCVALAACVAANAQGVAWEDLTDQQRQLLAPQAERWSELDPQRQQQIARGAQRWLDMNGDDQVGVIDLVAFARRIGVHLNP